MTAISASAIGWILQSVGYDATLAGTVKHHIERHIHVYAADFRAVLRDWRSDHSEIPGNQQTVKGPAGSRSGEGRRTRIFGRRIQGTVITCKE